MPWRGPQRPGEYPTLGWSVGEWIEANVVIPDGDHLGERYLLTDEMWKFLLWFYRIDPHRNRFVYNGAQLLRSQKWGKDPFLAAIILAEGLAPVRFDGWDAAGEPVGRRWPTPLIQAAAVSEDQADNTFVPIYRMIVEGPLVGLRGMDPGETRINLPGGGRIEPVTAAAKSRLGQRLTFAGLGETHLWVEAAGGIRLAANMKRNAAGMGGRWAEVTNAWDPAEMSVAQRTAEGAGSDVYLDHRRAPEHVSLSNKTELRRALKGVYGDSWWVDIDRVMDEILRPSTAEADARRYFLSQTVAGMADLVDPLVWDAQAHPEEALVGETQIALGFDGSKTDDATALIACRIDDSRLFTLRVWERPSYADDDWRVPSVEVDKFLTQVFEAYRVTHLFADPWKWQDYLDAWSARWPKRVVEFPTNVDVRMDKAIERFTTSFRSGELTHDGSEVLTRHVKNCVLAKGKRKPPRDDGGPPGHYMRMARRSRILKIDAAVAAVLAKEAQGHAVEHGALAAEPTISFI